MDWPPRLELPDPSLVCELTEHLTGNTVAGGAVATSIYAVFFEEVYRASGQYEEGVCALAKSLGRSREALDMSYKRSGKRPYIRVLAQTIMREAIMHIEAEKYNRLSDAANDTFKKAARRSLANHAGGAV